MTNFWEDLPFDEALDKYREILPEFELNEEFFRPVLSKILGGQNKLFLELVVEKYEDEIELLEVHIQSYNFRDPKEFYQNLPPPVHRKAVLSAELQILYDSIFKARAEGLAARLITKYATTQSDQEDPESCRSLPSQTQAEILLPTDLQIEYDLGFIAKTEGLAARLITKYATTPSNQEDPKSCRSLPSPTQEEILLPADLQTLYDSIGKTETEGLAARLTTKDAAAPSDQEDPEEVLSHDGFIDPIAEYMELLLNPSSLACFISEDHILQQQPVDATILIMRAYTRMMLLRSEIISQQVHLVFQLLEWLHWLFDLT